MTKSVRHPEKGYFLSLSRKDANSINRTRAAKGLPMLPAEELIDLQVLKIHHENKSRDG